MDLDYLDAIEELEKERETIFNKMMLKDMADLLWMKKYTTPGCAEHFQCSSIGNLGWNFRKDLDGKDLKEFYKSNIDLPVYRDCKWHWEFGLENQGSFSLYAYYKDADEEPYIEKIFYGDTTPIFRMTWTEWKKAQRAAVESAPPAIPRK